MRRNSLVLYVVAFAGALSMSACAPESASDQPLTPSGSARPPAAPCDATSLATSDVPQTEFRRGPEEWEPAGTTYVTVTVSVRVVVPCTGGNWQLALESGSGAFEGLGQSGDAGPFGPYRAGDVLTFWLSRLESGAGGEQQSARVQINGFEVAVIPAAWSAPLTTWSGPAIGNPTHTFPAPG